MNASDHDTQISQVRQEIVRVRAAGKPVRYPEAVKKQVAALRAAGVPALRLAAELQLAASQIHNWHRLYKQQGAQVFDIQPSAEPGRLPPTDGRQISVTLGHFELTIVCKEP